MLSWGTSLVAQLVKNPPTMQETPVLYWVGKIHRRKNRLPTSVFLGFPGGSAGKEYTCKAGDLGLIPGLGRSLEEGKGYSLQYFGLENSMDCIVHRATKSHKRLSYFHLYYLEDLLEEAWQPTPEFLPGEPMDRGACLATVCGVTKSQIWLKWLSTYACYIHNWNYFCAVHYRTNEYISFLIFFFFSFVKHSEFSSGS